MARIGRTLARCRESRPRIDVALALVAIAVGAGATRAQEMTPRAYWPAPVGTKVAVLGYQFSTGDIVTDPSLPIAGVDSSIHFAQVAYQQFFSVAGRTASVQGNLPYSRGTTEGLVDGEYRRRDTAGFGDVRARFAVNLRGAPAMDGPQFQALRAAPRTLVGASLTVQAPTGDYDPDRLINIGTHRWSAKPAVGVIWPFRPTWALECEAGVWVFGDNDDFVGGVTREQDPVLSTEIHLVKQTRAGFWVSIDANYYVGGRTTVDGTLRADLQRNARAGATFSIPVDRGHVLRFAFSTGLVVESGGDYDIFNASYLYAWH